MKMETIKQKDNENTAIEFDKIKVSDLGVKDQYRKIPVPRHRFTPLKQNWDSILKTLVEHMKLQVRMNTKRRAVELKTSKHTTDISAI
jgi:RNA-binding protein PNO1